MFLAGLDERDRRIVALLIDNARMSYSEIGQQVGISRVAVAARVKALEERGILEGYTAIVNPQRISGAVSCYFELELAPEAFGQAAERLRACGMVTQVYRVTGRNKLHVHAVAESNEAMEAFIREEMDSLPGVLSSSCSIILARIKDVKGLRL